MDKSVFTQAATGRLIWLQEPIADWAFVPDDLPPDWMFSDDLWPLLADAREALGTLNGIGQTLPDPELLLRPLQNQESVSSSIIEGTYVTPQQLLLYELQPNASPRTTESQSDQIEVTNYGRALRLGCEMISEQPFSDHVIRSVHDKLMQGVRGQTKSPGQYRRAQVQIGSNARYVPPPPIEIPRLMGNLVDFANETDDGIDPLVKSFVSHYQFEAIHPFADGNGRVGRVLMAMMIYKWCDHTQPWLYLSPFFEKHRDEYVRSMFRISTKGDWQSWVSFCLQATVAQSKDAIARCHRFRELRGEFFDRLTHPSPRSHTLIENLFRTPILTVRATADALGVTYPTARADLGRLVECGILQEMPDTYPKAFCAQEIMAIAFGDSAKARP